MLLFIQVNLIVNAIELRKMREELLCQAEHKRFASWRADGTLCLRGFFSVYSNYGTERSQPLLLPVVMCFLLLSLEYWCRSSYF